MTGEHLAQRIAEIAQQMPTACDLDRVRRTLANANGVGAGPVTGNDLHAGVRLEPRGSIGLTVGQQINGALRSRSTTMVP
ncbi:hypothetical protein M2351_005565 [Azospirillum canadense]|nr:hypothetical protein [Azospirillum canadense]